ncbi:MAG: uroporphyrinogen-III C-methyltransferase [Hyphomicrobiales bacterium]
MKMKRLGKVVLVGAGPGDPELLTLKAVRAIEAADVVVYDRLVAPEILAMIPANAERVDVGKRTNHHPVPQHEINELLVRYGRLGLNVVRLKGGDPFIFGRGCEEASALEAAGIACSVVPGITAAQGAAASAGVPLTHRGMARSVRYVTGHCRADEPLDLDWAGMADAETTLVIYMGLASIREITTELMAHGLAGDTPVLAVANATARNEVRLSSRLSTIEADAAAAGLGSPVVFIIGQVAGLAEHRLPDVIATARSVRMKEALYA